jgi:hypothetical protein
VRLYNVQHLELWHMLSTLPKLARLCLDLRTDYHSGMPDVAALPTLTHLSLQCCASMLGRDEGRGVELPLLQVGWLPPARCPAIAPDCCQRPLLLPPWFSQVCCRFSESVEGPP